MYVNGIVLGQLVEVQDLLLGKIWKAKVVGINHKVGSIRGGGFGAETVLDLELPTDYY